MWVAWPSGLRRWIKAPVSSEAWVQIPPLPVNIFTKFSPRGEIARLLKFSAVFQSPYYQYSYCLVGRSISNRREISVVKGPLSTGSERPPGEEVLF